MECMEGRYKLREGRNALRGGGGKGRRGGEGRGEGRGAHEQVSRWRDP